MSQRVTAVSRRVILGAAATLGLSGQAFAQARLRPTPSCDDGDDPTPPQTAGPFFKPRSPQRSSLIEPDMAGTRLVLSGTVTTRSCRPVPRTLIDLWQANAKGIYDNAGYRLRGHQFTDADGRFRFETIVPGSYDGRTRHLHLRIQAANGRILTTQLYFPGEALNARDGLFDPALLMQTRDTAGQIEATYPIVLAMLTIQSVRSPASPFSLAKPSKVPPAFQASAEIGASSLRRTRISAPSDMRTINTVPLL